MIWSQQASVVPKPGHLQDSCTVCLAITLVSSSVSAILYMANMLLTCVPGMEHAVSGDEMHPWSPSAHPWLRRPRAHREASSSTRGRSSKVLWPDCDLISSTLPSTEEMGSTVEGRVRQSMLGKHARCRTSNDLLAVYHDRNNFSLLLSMQQELTPLDSLFTGVQLPHALAAIKREADV